MTSYRKALFMLLSYVLILAGGAIVGWTANSYIYSLQPPRTTPLTEVEIVATERTLEKELIRLDLKEIGSRIGLSERQQSEYLTYLDSASVRYTVPMMLIHSVISIESGYDPSAVHPTIAVRGKSTRAIGLCGIVWEYNFRGLMEEHIAVSRMELTEPRINILASAYLIHSNLQLIFAKSPALSEDHILDELVKRYYGAYNDAYKSQMLSKMRDVASTQWIKRVIKTLKLDYRTIHVYVPIPQDSLQTSSVVSPQLIKKLSRIVSNLTF